MRGYTEEPLSCSECGAVGSYIPGQVSDVTCRECANEVNWVDFTRHLDEGELLKFNADGVLCVYIPED